MSIVAVIEAASWFCQHLLQHDNTSCYAEIPPGRQDRSTVYQLHPQWLQSCSHQQDVIFELATAVCYDRQGSPIRNSLLQQEWS